MTLREILPEWWCKVTFSLPKKCLSDYNWFDFLVYEFLLTSVIILIIKWIIDFFFLILGLINHNKKVDATIISPSILENENGIYNDNIEDMKLRDLRFDEDVFSLEEDINLSILSFKLSIN